MKKLEDKTYEKIEEIIVTEKETILVRAIE